MKLPITTENNTLNIPHLGITLRSLMGAAITCNTPFPDNKRIPVTYKQATIAYISLGKDFN